MPNESVRITLIKLSLTMDVTHALKVLSINTSVLTFKEGLYN